MTLPRGPWEELQLRDADASERLLYCPGWTNNRETLILSIRETGWFSSSIEAWDAAERAELLWGFMGTDDDGNLVICSLTGRVGETEEHVVDIEQVTVARITTPA